MDANFKAVFGPPFCRPKIVAATPARRMSNTVSSFSKKAQKKRCVESTTYERFVSCPELLSAFRINYANNFR
jgi:hypothetical protein